MSATPEVEWMHPAARPRAHALVLPGANCRAARYRWLGEALAGMQVSAGIVEAPLTRRPALLEPTRQVEGRFVTVALLERVVHRVIASGVSRLALIGHSLGGVVALQAIEPAEARCDPNSGVEATFAGIGGIDQVITGGATLEAEVMGTRIPWRRVGVPLFRPAGTTVHLLAGSADGLIPPELVEATARRFHPAVATVVLPGVTHFGWTDGHEATDRLDLDGTSTLDGPGQKRAILAALRACLSGPSAQHHGN